MWDGFHAYKLYVACHIQFNRAEKWDIRNLEFGKRLPLKKTTFENRTDKRLFEILAINFSMKELFAYYVANFLYGHKFMVYDVDLGRKNYNRWIGNKERLTYLVKTDLKTISDRVSIDYLSKKFVDAHEEELTNQKNVGNIWKLDPICIFNMYKVGLINIETLIAMDKVCKIVDSFRNNYSEMAAICEPDYLLIRKANIFLKLSPQIEEMINNFLN